MLYIVSTPIGNLKDITLRALEVLKSCDAILCEDTRVSKNLLNAYEISKPLLAYHSFNEKKRLDEILDRLSRGENLALISDAGTPLIQDPGYILIQACQERGLPYTTVPGASSILSALVLSGFDINQFQFLGFLPKKTQDATQVIKEINKYDGLSVFFESPKRVVETLELLKTHAPEHMICVIREMTKKFETVHKGRACELLEYFNDQSPRGEIVFVVQGQKQAEERDLTDYAFELLSLGLSKKSAYQLASRFGFVDKDRLYKENNN